MSQARTGRVAPPCHARFRPSRRPARAAAVPAGVRRCDWRDRAQPRQRKTMNRSDARTPAQLYALLFGITLLAVGILGFIADSSFDTGSNVQGSDFIIFEVNGWHNLVHIASGAAGIALAPRRQTRPRMRPPRRSRDRRGAHDDRTCVPVAQRGRGACGGSPAGLAISAPHGRRVLHRAPGRSRPHPAGIPQAATWRTRRRRVPDPCPGQAATTS